MSRWPANACRAYFPYTESLCRPSFCGSPRMRASSACSAGAGSASRHDSSCNARRHAPAGMSRNSSSAASASTSGASARRSGCVASARIRRADRRTHSRVARRILGAAQRGRAERVRVERRQVERRAGEARVVGGAGQPRDELADDGRWTDWVMMFGGPRVAGSDRLGWCRRQRGRSLDHRAAFDRLAVDCGDESALRHAAPRQWRAGAQARLRRRLSARGARSRPRAAASLPAAVVLGRAARLPHRLPRRATARAAARTRRGRRVVSVVASVRNSRRRRAPRADIGPMARGPTGARAVRFASGCRRRPARRLGSGTPCPTGWCPRRARP